MVSYKWLCKPVGDLHFIRYASHCCTRLCLSLCFDVTSLSQVRWKEVSSLSSSAYHQCYHRLPQRGLVHPPEDSLQCPSHIPCYPAQRDHLGRWRQCCRCENYKHTHDKHIRRLTDRKIQKTLFESWVTVREAWGSISSSFCFQYWKYI